MAKIKKSDFMDKLNIYIGEDNSEAAIELIEDIADSWDEEAGGEDWEAKYHELDESWKKRYKERFFDGDNQTPTEEEVDGNTHEEEAEKEILTYEDFYKDIEVKE